MTTRYPMTTAMTPPATPDISAHSVLVVGSGSIGRRHLKNLRALGATRLAACDPNPERLAPMQAELTVEPFADLATALAAFRPDAVFIATPPSLHVPQARAAIAAGAHVFVEKPLSHTREGVAELAAEAHAAQRIVQLGYNLRFHPGVLKLKELLDSGVLGRLQYVQAESAQYLPDWRPWQDYRQSYTAHRELGGGILLDGSHELDYLLWLLGPPCEVTCMMGKVSDLEVNVEDCVDLLFRYASEAGLHGKAHRAQAHVHLDFAQRGYWRSCRLSGDQGSAVWDFRANEVRLYTAQPDPAQSTWQSFAYPFEANDMYLAECRHFFECIRTGTQPLVGIADGERILRLCEVATVSSQTGQRLTFPTIADCDSLG